jgi:hypothetical protein
MTSQLLITLLTAFGGIILGFLLSQLGDYLRATREDKRVLKQVLFNQLDIWVELKKADVETLLPLLLEKFQQGLLKRGAPSTEVNAVFANVLGPLIELFRSLKLAAPENLKERYQDSVNQLAKVDPLLAYQLSGRPRTDLNEIVDTFIEKASQLEAESAQRGSNPDAVSRFSSFIKTYGLKKMLGNMEADIMDVARAIGYFTKRRTRRRVNELTIRLSEDVEDIVDQFLDSLVQFASHNAMPPASKENRI